MSIGKDSLSLIMRKMNHEIGPEEFYSEMMLLDKRYPGIGFKEAAEAYARRLRKRVSAEVIEFKRRASEPEETQPEPGWNG